MKSKRHGSSQVDWIVGFLFFMMIVFISIYYISYVSKSRQPYEDPLKSQLVDISRSLEEELQWTAYTVPVTFKSDYFLKDYPISIEYEIDSKTKNSTHIYDRSGNIITTEVDVNESKIYWISDIIKGKNQFHMTYITNSNLNESPNTTTNDFSIQDLKISNTIISTEIDNFSIVSLRFNGMEFVDGGITLSTTQKPLIINSTLRVIAKYPENLSITFYTNNSRVLIKTDTPKDFILHLDNYLTRFHVDGTSYLFNGTNTYTGITSYADLYNDTGIALIGKDLNLTIDDTGTTRDIYLFNETEFEIYMHDGNYANILNESNIYPGPDIIIGLPERISGIREDRITELEELYYEELTEKLQIDDLGILVRIEDKEA